MQTNMGKGNMLRKQLETKRGAAAIYVVIFTATLLSIIALSFVRLMLSEMGRTTNYSLSQSAYNSALAGIEDAKIVLLRYQNCINNPNYTVNGTSVGCGKLIEYLQTNVEKYSQDCDLVGEALGYNTSNHETIIQTKSKETINESAKTFDQAYTCVKISPQNKDYITTLTQNYPTKIVPLRTNSDESTDSINRVVISWFSNTDLSNAKKKTNHSYHNFGGGIIDGINMPVMNGTTIDNNAFLDDYHNSFTSTAIIPPVLQATLIQTAKKFKLSEFYSSKKESSDYRTNRGTITLRPTTANPYNVSITNYSNHIGGNDRFSFHGGPFATSATKSQNTPLDVHCFIDDEGERPSNGYACTADIYIPKPINYSSTNKRNPTTFFLVLNLPYGDPETEVNVELKHCNDNSDSIYGEGGEGNCNSVKFVNVQPIVDSTGRANDLFRRIEARVELVDTYYPIVNYALAVNDPESDDDNVVKDFYVTKNCSYSESKWNSSEGKVEEIIDKSCNNSGHRGN